MDVQRRPSLARLLSAALDPPATSEESTATAIAAATVRKEPKMVSLMSLLAQTDRMERLREASPAMVFPAHGDQDEGEEEEEEEEERYEEPERECCVCMVRHKEQELECCGHAFCRLCSREMRVEKGRCPLCNGFILEILNIF